MHLKTSLAYPIQGNGWSGRLLALTLIQFIPIVGQAILVGYGLEIVRSVYAGSNDLPPIRFLRALGDGLTLLAACLLYLLPVLLAVPILLTTGLSQDGSGSDRASSLAPLGIALGALLVVPLLGRALKSYPSLGKAVSALGGILLIVLVASSAFRLSQVQAEIDLSGLQLNAIGEIQLVVLTILLLLILLAVRVAGVRFAIEGTGLLKPNQTIQMMARHRRKTAALFLMVLLLDALAVLAIGLGLALLLLPGLFFLVLFGIIGWRLIAVYGLIVGIQPQ